MNKTKRGNLKLAKFLDKENLDVICFQETYSSIPIVISSSYKYIFTYRDCGLSILSNSIIKNKKTLRLEEDKGCIYGLINGYNFFNLHLDHLCEKTRLKQIISIMKFIDDIVLENRLPVIICGDFNSLNILDYTAKKWKHMLENEKEYTFEESLVYNRITKKYKDSRKDKSKNPSTSINDRRVDYIFTDFKIDKGSEIIDGLELSDHNPVLLEI